MSNKCIKCKVQFDPNSYKHLIGIYCKCSSSLNANFRSTIIWQAWTNAMLRDRSGNVILVSQKLCQLVKLLGISQCSLSSKAFIKNLPATKRIPTKRFNTLDQTLNALRESVSESQQKIKLLEEDNDNLNDQVQFCRTKENVLKTTRTTAILQTLQH